MKRLLALALLGLLWALPAQAQRVQNPSNAAIVCAFNNAPPTLTSGWFGYVQCDNAGQVKITGSISSSTTGFPTIQSTGTPISVTSGAGGVTGTLPTGAVVVASNVGATNGAYCKLGASATTSDQLIPPNSWFAFTVGANTQLTCITASSTTTVNMVGGSGLPTGSGGGGGGSGGAITAASGAFALGSISSGAMVDLGAQADAVCGSSTGSCSLIALIKFLNNAAIAAIPAGTNTIGGITTPLQTTGGWTTKLLVSQSSPVTLIKATAGWLGKVYCYNPSAAVAYLQVFNATPITVGSTIPAQSYGIPATNTSGFIMPLPGDQYSTQIAVASTTTATGSVGASMDCNVSFN